MYYRKTTCALQPPELIDVALQDIANHMQEALLVAFVISYVCFIVSTAGGNNILTVDGKRFEHITVVVSLGINLNTFLNTDCQVVKIQGRTCIIHFITLDIAAKGECVILVVSHFAPSFVFF